MWVSDRVGDGAICESACPVPGGAQASASARAHARTTEGATAPHGGTNELLPEDFPFALRSGDTIDAVRRYTTSTLQITSVSCHTRSTAAAGAEHYERALKKIRGFRVAASDETRTRDDGSSYQVFSIMAVHRFQSNISISLITSKTGRTAIEITWRHHLTPPKGAPEDWSPATYH